MKQIVTSYIPFKGYNIYVANVRRLLTLGGYASFPIRKILSNPIMFFRCKIFNFNWFEEAYSRGEYIKKTLLLKILKLFNKKIVFTLHNKHPHEISNQWSNKMTYEMCVLADVIVGLCPDTIEVVRDACKKAVDKVRIIPHPNYIKNYENIDKSDYRKKFGIKDNDLVFLYLGTISPYKNVDLLLEIFSKLSSPNIWLIIAGNPSESGYGEDLKEKISKLKNVICDFRHIPENEIANYYCTSDVVILPYQKDSYLNSGAVYLSFSLKKTVVCPMIGSIKMLNDKSFVYAYDYSDEKEHGTQLESAIQKVLNDYQNDPTTPIKMGLKAYEYVKIEHSDDKVSNLYEKVYKSLV